MEQGKLETAEERKLRRHNRYVKERAQGKNSAFHMDKDGNPVKGKRKKLSDLSEEEKKRQREKKHLAYLRGRAEGKSWAYNLTNVPPKPLTEEQKEKRRVYSAEYKKLHREQTLENIRKWHREHYEEEKKSWQEYRRTNKKKCIEYLGGKCVRCGGVYHPDVYDFHHENGDAKDRCVAKMLTRKFENIIPELEKCILLCANCHRIEHSQYEWSGSLEKESL